MLISQTDHFFYQVFFAYGAVIGITLSASLLMLFLSIYQFYWHKKRDSGFLFLYNSVAVLGYALFSLYAIYSHFPTIVEVVSYKFLFLCKVAVPISLYMNARMFIKSIPSFSMRAFTFWYENKFFYRAVDLVYLLSFFALISIQSQQTVMIVSLALMLINVVVAIIFIIRVFRSNLLSRLYLWSLLFLSGVLLLLIWTYSFVDLSNLINLSSLFVVLHIALSLLVLLCSFLLMGSVFSRRNLISQSGKFSIQNLYKSAYFGLKHNEFYLVYQPKTNTKTGEVVGIEALVRWEHRTKGNIPPSDFIPIAERGHLIDDICKWVIATAIVDAKALYDQKVITPVSINFSVNNITTQLVKRLKRSMDEHNLPTYMVTIEITESLFLDMSREQKKALKMLKTFGIRLSLDDFSAGFSSLKYLDEIGLNELKIDRELTVKILDEGKNPVVSGIIDMCKSLDIKVVAEGVEDDEVLRALRDMDCEMAQGYGICRPKKFDDFVRWYQANLMLTSSS